MRACLGGQECEPKEKDKWMILTNVTFKREYLMAHSNKKCGQDFAYAYFVTFVFFSSFLVIEFFKNTYTFNYHNKV